jgi:hypothetical protein
MAKSPKITQKNGRRYAGGRPIAKGDFALPGGGPGGEDAYPIDTKGRARSALGRAAKNATPAQKAQIKAAVRKKYPSIAVDGKKTTTGRSGGRAAARGGKAAGKGK